MLSIKNILVLATTLFISNAYADELIKKYNLIDSTWSENCVDKNQTYYKYEGSFLDKNSVTAFYKNEKYAIGKNTKIEELSPEPKMGWPRIKVTSRMKNIKTGEESTVYNIFMYNPERTKRRLMDTFLIDKNRPLVINSKIIYYDKEGNEIKPPEGVSVTTKIQEKCLTK